MPETKKGGFIKRLFGGKKEGCCGVQIEEIKDESGKEKNEPGKLGWGGKKIKVETGLKLIIE